MNNTLENEIRCPECRRKVLADMILERAILECHYCSAKFQVSTYKKIETFYLTEKVQKVDTTYEDAIKANYAIG